MALLAKWKGQSLKLGGPEWSPPSVLGFTQFCINFNSVYLAERYITSGVVATVFALLLIPNSLLAWAFLGQRPSGRFVLGSAGGDRRHRLAVRARTAQHPAARAISRSASA